MFINHQGPPKRDPDIRRLINTHLSKVANERRRPKIVTRLDRRAAQQKRRAREAAEAEEMEFQHEALTRTAIQHAFYSGLNLRTDLMTPLCFKQEEHVEVKASYEYLSVILPTDFRAIGMSDVLIRESVHTMLQWAHSHELVFPVLAIYRLCLLHAAKIAGTEIRTLIEQLRSKVLVQMNKQLARKAVGDVLMWAVSFLIVVDDFLGYIDYGLLHLRGLETMIELRGGYAAVGSTITADVPRLAMHQLLGNAMNAMRLNSRFALISGAGVMRHQIIQCEQDKCVIELPHGFRKLAELGYLSTQTIEALLEYEKAIRDPAHCGNVEVLKLWRTSVFGDSSQATLSNFEKCIFIAMECLAADLSYGVYQTSMAIWRKTRQRAQKVLEEPSLWYVPDFRNCALWIGTVIMSPTQLDSTPFDLRMLFQDRMLKSRSHLKDYEEVESVLSAFFYPRARQSALKQAWAARYPE